MAGLFQAPDNIVVSTAVTTFKFAAFLFLLGSSIVVVGAVISQLRFRKPFPRNAPRFASDASNLPLVGSRRFFYDRWSFFREWSWRMPTGNWSYYVGVNRMIGVSGAEGRQKVFQARELNFEDGINFLFGFTSTKNSKGESFNDFFLRRIKGVLHTDNLQVLLPQLMADVTTRFRAMATGTSSQARITDPFESIYGTIFRLTMRMFGCDEAAEDPELEKTIITTLQVAESCSTPATIIFPWFPLFYSRIRRMLAFLRLYNIFCGFFSPGIIRRRIQSGEQHQDALQQYLNFGDDELDTFSLIVAALFSAQVNSGINASWMLLYLADNIDWKAKALAEVTAVANQYNPSPDTPLADKLVDIPLHAWETQFPVIDACFKETIRIQTIGIACRRNDSGMDLPLGKSGEVLPAGAYITYHLFDAHRDERIYADAERWDPDRYGAARAEHTKAPLAYLGWGAGRHVCAGMRFAKLENTLLAAALARHVRLRGR